jgi:hypothetical protein
MWLNVRRICGVWKNLQELKQLEEVKILSMSWWSLKNQANWDLPKNLEQLKKIEELKILRDSERKDSWLIQPVDQEHVWLRAVKNVEESKKPEHLKNVEQLKIVAENLQELKVPLRRMSSHL